MFYVEKYLGPVTNYFQGLIWFSLVKYSCKSCGAKTSYISLVFIIIMIVL